MARDFTFDVNSVDWDAEQASPAPAYVPPAVADADADGLFEVHYWPHTGRVMTVHLLDADATVTDLRLVGTGGSASKHLSDATAALAEHLANNSNPQGSLVEHWHDATVTYLYDRPGEDTDEFDMRSAEADIADFGSQDRRFRLETAGITLPGPDLSLSNLGPLADGGRRATLLREGIVIGAIVQLAADRPSFEASDPSRRPQLLADLVAFARSCRADDGEPVTLSVLLASLLTDYATRPTRRSPR